MSPSSTRLPPISAQELNAMTAAQWQAILAGDPAKLARFLKAAAELGDIQAQAMLGQLLLDGHGIEKNQQEAFRWFADAASKGHTMAMNMAGRCLQYGWGVAIDAVAAADWFRQAAEKGLDWGMYNYANLLTTGNGVSQDNAAALGWYRRAAEMGHAKSLNLVGRFYEEGIAVAADKTMAFAYYRQSAHGGDFRGQYSYATMLAERGSISEAAAWLRKIPATATVGFLQKIGPELAQSPHPAISTIGQEILLKSA